MDYLLNKNIANHREKSQTTGSTITIPWSSVAFACLICARPRLDSSEISSIVSTADHAPIHRTPFHQKSDAEALHPIPSSQLYPHRNYVF